MLARTRAPCKLPCKGPSLRLRPSRCTTAAPEPAPKTFNLTVVPPPPGEETNLTCDSGELIRPVLLANKIELYNGMWNKAMNCNGAGQCGTCVIEVLEGMEYLSGRTGNEEKKLSKKPDNFRLACQTQIGDGEDCGAVKIRTLPPM